MSKETDKTVQQLQDVLDFTKMAFCIDGEIEPMPAKVYSFDGVPMKLTDSKRGTFYVAIIPEDGLTVVED